MKLNFDKHEERRAPLVLSVVAHVVIVALVASLTFHYSLGDLFRTRDLVPAEHVQYVRVQPTAAASPAAGNGSSTKPRPKKAAAPAPLVSPTTVPTELPAVPPPSVSAGAIGGTGTGSGGAPAGMATGVEPALPDSRIELRPNTLRLPLTMAQKNDSAVKAIYMAYREAEIEEAAHKGKDPRDWTFEKNGGKYGMDSSYIYLGKFKIPSAILAALPFNSSGVNGQRLIEGRNANWIREDIYSHSQGLSEEDFRTAIKRIRERKDKERREAEEARRPAVVP